MNTKKFNTQKEAVEYYGHTCKYIEKHYTTLTINRDFRIKVNGLNNEGKKINTLVGVSGCIALIGEEMMEKFLSRAYKQGLDACTCKLRRGLKVTFYAK